MNRSVKHIPSILIVDDQPMNIQLLSRLLSEDYEILAATCGSKALEIAQSQTPPDLVLLDINMPDVDGYEVCKQLKSEDRTRDIPVIFITARHDAQDEERGFLLGGSDYIVKPFQPMVVSARIRNQINLKVRTDLLREIARTDGLTGIPNRRSYDEHLDTVWKRCARDMQEVSMLMIDIDHFKAFNDRYGHGAGDVCLRRVAQALSSVLHRSLEMLCRYGGEEFAAVLPSVGRDKALPLAEAMLKAVYDLGIPHDSSPAAPVVTVSIGCASLLATPEGSPLDLARRADEALYAAKKEGRNRVAPA